MATIEDVNERYRVFVEQYLSNEREVRALKERVKADERRSEYQAYRRRLEEYAQSQQERAMGGNSLQGFGGLAEQAIGGLQGQNGIGGMVGGWGENALGGITASGQATSVGYEQMRRHMEALQAMQARQRYDPVMPSPKAEPEKPLPSITEAAAPKGRKFRIPVEG